MSADRHAGESFAEALRALYDLAPRCDVCEEHRATREGERVHVCDRADCGDCMRCPLCHGGYDVGDGAEGCVWCGYSGAVREPRSTAWRDLPHAAALRAANAAHEAR